jgi:hypothetical protein
MKNINFSLTPADDKLALDIFEPELSKWEREELLDEKNDKTEVNDKETTSTEITSDIIKRAENVMFSKNLHSNESNKANASESLSSVIKKLDGDKKYESFQVTVPADFNSGTRSVELQRDDHKESKRSGDEPQQRTSIKDRLGKKIDSKRSRSRDRKSTKKEGNNEKRSYQMSSTISSVHKPAGRNDKRTSRRSRTPEYRRHKRSRTSSPNRNVAERQDRKHKERAPEEKVADAASKGVSSRGHERDKKSRSVSHSPKKQNHKETDKKRSRSRSSDSRKNRKKKKKEKKTKKHKSRERK